MERIDRTAMVVLSGGQDSTICLFWALSQYTKVKAITFDYGQKHSIEIEAARKIAELAGVEHEVVAVPDILKSRSPLTDPTAELENYSDFESMDEIIGDRVELTFVPMRNAFFLTLAANRAVHANCFDLVTGVCQQDNANYPDCTGEFINAQERTINLALGIENFFIRTPLINMSKKQSIDLAMIMDGCMDALSYSHTCYAGVYPPCGECHSCVLRAEGFKQAGVVDPIYYLRAE